MLCDDEHCLRLGERSLASYDVFALLGVCLEMPQGSKPMGMSEQFVVNHYVVRPSAGRSSLSSMRAMTHRGQENTSKHASLWACKTRSLAPLASKTSNSLPNKAHAGRGKKSKIFSVTYRRAPIVAPGLLVICVA
eukprot:6492764-Amphidinium_carterae.4